MTSVPIYGLESHRNYVPASVSAPTATPMSNAPTAIHAFPADHFQPAGTSRPSSPGEPSRPSNLDMKGTESKPEEAVGENEEPERDNRDSRASALNGSLPSPPLTRIGTNESRPRTPDRLSEEKAEEMDVADWHPLGDHSPSQTDLRDVDQTQDFSTTMVEGGDDIVDSTGRLLFPEKTSPQRTRSNLHLDLRRGSPQPWDIIEPPPSNNGHSNSDFYSNRFTTLQSKSRSRPLKPKSSYYFGPPPSDSAYGTPPLGQIGVHYPREILRIERDYTGGELTQFAPIYPLELEGRITPTQFLESINAINEILISANSIRHSLFDNLLAIFTLQISRLFFKSHYDKQMHRLRHLFDELNAEFYNPVGLNILWPQNVAFLFLEIEYY